MLPSNVLKFVKKRKDAEKILQVFDGYTKKVKYPSLEVHQNMLLCLAVEYNHLQLVKLLARRGTDVNFHVSRILCNLKFRSTNDGNAMKCQKKSLYQSYYPECFQAFSSKMDVVCNSCSECILCTVQR